MRSSTKLFVHSLLAAVAAVLLAPPEAAAERYLVVYKQDAAAALERAQLVRAHGGKVFRDHPEIGVAIVTSEDGDFAAKLHSTGRVVGVRREVLRDAGFGGPTPVPAAVPRWALPEAQSAFAPPFVSPEILTQTFFYPFQWDVQKMRFDQAWALGFAGDPRTRVAVLASGIDYTHIEMAGRVDLERSKNFVPEDAAMVQQLFPGAHPIADLGLHGTFVASQIGCNALLYACTAPNVSLVGVKWLNHQEQGRTGDLVTSILYAAAIGSDIIVIPDKLGNLHPREDFVEVLALKLAVGFAKAAGALVIGGPWSNGFFECGFDADEEELLIMPAEAGTLVVGETGVDDQWGRDSSFGFSLIDVAAPGGQRDPATCLQDPAVFSSSIGACTKFSQFLAPNGTDFSQVCNEPNQPLWILSFGVRAAVAHAAGVAALIEDRYNDTKRGSFVRSKLLATADDVEAPGVDEFTGAGRVNAFRAVTE
jgi:subtilisin family serine protease